jgi:hypothetical protein
MGSRPPHISRVDDGRLSESIHHHRAGKPVGEGQHGRVHRAALDWIADCLQYLRDKKIRHIEADEGVENDWVAHVNDVADSTLYPQANSWYNGANMPGKPRVFMPYVAGLDKYRKICGKVAANDYRGFSLKSG